MLALSSLLTGQAGTDTSQELAHRSYLSQYYLGTLKVLQSSAIAVRMRSLRPTSSPLRWKLMETGQVLQHEN